MTEITDDDLAPYAAAIRLICGYPWTACNTLRTHALDCPALPIVEAVARRLALTSAPPYRPAGLCLDCNELWPTSGCGCAENPNDCAGKTRLWLDHRLSSSNQPAENDTMEGGKA